MTNRAKKYLSDILYALNLIEDFIAETKDFTAYLSDLKTQSAVERQLGIIGEATVALKKENPAILLEDCWFPQSAHTCL